jgi:hypothetical protein
MKHVVEVSLGSMMYLPNFMTMGSDIQITLRLLPQKFERLQCWYYLVDGLINCVVELAPGGMIFVPGFIQIDSGVHRLLGTHTHRERCSHKNKEQKMK